MWKIQMQLHEKSSISAQTAAACRRKAEGSPATDPPAPPENPGMDGICEPPVPPEKKEAEPHLQAQEPA